MMGGVLAPRFAQGFFRSFVRLGGWCLHFAWPLSFRFVRECFPEVGWILPPLMIVTHGYLPWEVTTYASKVLDPVLVLS